MPTLTLFGAKCKGIRARPRAQCGGAASDATKCTVGPPGVNHRPVTRIDFGGGGGSKGKLSSACLFFWVILSSACPFSKVILSSAYSDVFAKIAQKLYFAEN